MADEATPRHALPLLHVAQAQKEMFHNEALLALDLLTNAQALSRSLAAPPASPAPAPGEGWIVPSAGASGAWAGQENRLACWSAGGWRFLAPPAGTRVALADEALDVRWNGAAWVEEPARAGGYHVGGQQVIGPRAPAIADPAGGALADAEARAAIAAILAALRGHGLIAT